MVCFMVIEKINSHSGVLDVSEEVFGLASDSIKVSCRAVCEGAALCKILRVFPEPFTG
jgi:hypothetical protein